MKKMTVIAGPCVIEDEGLVLETAAELKRQLRDLKIDFYFKSSFDKANRSAIDSFRGPGLIAGLQILGKAKAQHGVSLLTDFHDVSQAEKVAEVVDFLQIPAFLCRQTDLIVAGAEAALKFNRRLNVKKGQFLAPWDTKNIVDKVRDVSQKTGGKPPESWLSLTERGTCFGYNTLIVDMSSFKAMKPYGVELIYDATHSVQMPGAAGKSTGGKRENIEVLARAAFAAGAEGLFLECHPDPKKAKSDGPNAFPLEKVGEFVEQLLALRSFCAAFTPLI